MNDTLSMRRARLTRPLRRFAREDDGAATVDWVVLTAAIVLLGMGAGFIVTSAVPGLADKIDEVLRKQEVVPD